MHDLLLNYKGNFAGGINMKTVNAVVGVVLEVWVTVALTRRT